MSGRELLRGVVREHRGRTALAALFLGAHQGFEVLVPVVVGAAIDGAVAPQDGEKIALWVGVLVVLFGFLSSSFRIGARIEHKTTETAAHRLRMRLVERVVDPRGGGEGGLLPGQLLSVATADVDAVAHVLRGLAYGAGVVVALGAGATVLLLTSLTLGLTVLLGLPVVVWAGGRLGGLLSRRSATQQQEAADASGVAADLVTGLRVLQGIRAADAGAHRYRIASQASLRATLTAAKAEIALASMAVLMGGFAVAGVAFVGGRLAASGDFSLGELIAAVGVTQFLVGPLQRLGWVGGVLARAHGSAGRLVAALDAPPALAAPTGEPAPAPSGPLALHVEPAGLDVPSGAVVGVVADDPEPLLLALGREADPPAGGRILVGGTDLAALDPAAARATIVVAPHEATLLSGTVRHNVPGPAPAVDAALEAAAAGDVLAALPDGLDTELTDAGSSLSGGQRQRIALARALATAAPVLVLHEPTTALDAATEARVARALRVVRAGATTVLFTTSPMLLAACDTVAIVRDGAVVAQAAHAELLAADAGYREAVG